MAFCMYCGKKLEEGETCSCQNSVSGQQEEWQGVPQNSNQQTNWQGAPQNNGQPVNWQGTPQNNGQPTNWQGMPQNNNQQANWQGMPPNNNQQINWQGMPQINQQQYQEKFNQAKKVSGMFLKDLWVELLELLKHPATEGKRLALSADNRMSFGLIGLQAILSGIFVMEICGKFNSLAKSALSFSSNVDGKYLFSMPKVFLLTAIGSIIFSMIVASLLYAGSKIFQGQPSFGQMIGTSAVRSVGNMILILISIVFGFFGIMGIVIGFVIYGSSWLSGLLFGIPAVREASGVKEDKQVYMLGIIIFIAMIAFSILLNIGMPMYLPEGAKLKNILNLLQ